MVRFKYLIIIVSILVLNFKSFPQVKKSGFIISCGINLISSSEIYSNPYSPNLIERNRSFEIRNIFSPSLEIEYRFNEEVSIGISTEYVKTIRGGNYIFALAGNQVVELESEDGFVFVPFELSVYQLLPFSTENFNFILGGGLGYYSGYHLRNFGDAQITTLESSLVFGILVSAAIDYKIFENIALSLKTKYRAPEIKVKSRYDQNVINYKGKTINLIEDTFNSKIGINGTVFSFSLKYLF